MCVGWSPARAAPLRSKIFSFLAAAMLRGGVVIARQMIHGTGC